MPTRARQRRAPAQRPGVRGVPFVTTVQGAYSAGSAAKRAYNRIRARGDRVIAVSDIVAEHVKELYGCPRDRVHVVHQGIDAREFDPSAISAMRSSPPVPLSQPGCVRISSLISRGT